MSLAGFQSHLLLSYSSLFNNISSVLLEICLYGQMEQLKML
jgi:hypothetical protein